MPFPQVTPLANSPLCSPHVSILLATHFGESYLEEQLNSIADQSHDNWKVWASDDASKDSTASIFEVFFSKWGGERLDFRTGPGAGHVVNFLSLVLNPLIDGDYFAYCDQDDIWEPDKLARAVAILEAVPSTVPALYCARTRLIDACGQDLGVSPVFHKQPCFANALVQNIAGGNTMVFNRAARTLLQTATDLNDRLPNHDWWTYLVVSACGGGVYFDAVPTLRYRQHPENQIGQGLGVRNRLNRYRLLLQGSFSRWYAIHLLALSRIRYLMSPENQKIFDTWTEARNLALFPRLIALRRAGIHRQTVRGNLGYFVEALLNKI